MRDGTPAIVRTECPFGQAAIEHPVLCAIDRGVAKGLFAGLCGEAISVQLSSRARGDAVCGSVTA